MSVESRSEFCNALIARESSLPADAQIFAPFIGSWSLVVRWWDEQGALVRTEDGEWHFAWVLGGRGVQGVWIVPPRAQHGDGRLYEYGTSIRFFDPALQAWRSTWIGPVHGVVRTFTARSVGADVVLQTTPNVSPALRWSFTDVTPEAFSWRNEIQVEDGWRLQQSFEAVRQA